MVNTVNPMFYLNHSKEPAEMVQKHSLRLMRLGFIFSSVLIVCIIVVSLHYLQKIKNTSEQMVIEGSVKLQLSHQMASAVRQRGYLLLQFLLLEQQVDKEDVLILFDNQAGHYAKVRKELLSLPLSDTEKHIIADLDREIRISRPLHEEAINAFLWDETQTVQLILNRTLKARNSLLNKLSQLTELQEKNVKEAVAQIENQYQHAKNSMLLLGFLVLLLAVGIFYLVYYNALIYNRKMSDTHTELKAIRYKLEQSNWELHHKRQLADDANKAKSEFLANMSHELRTPLNAIIGYSEIIQEDANLLTDKSIANDIDKIHHAGHHLLNVVNDLLNLSKIEAGRMELYLEHYPLSALLDDVVATIYPLIRQKGNKLLPHYEKNLGMIELDVIKMRQILLNLLSNANKFTENGEITLYAQANHCLHLSIQDTGVGMTGAQINKLFNPFIQADQSITRKYGGTGLGLVISKRFVEMMGGRIEVNSQQGQGSVFEIYLPLQQNP